MLKKTTAFIFVACSFLSSFCQEATPKKTDVYIGVQFNQLIRQLLNFSNTGTAINNPYLVTFAANSSHSGNGINFGIGYTFNEINDGDAFTSRETKINDLFVRAGYEKKCSLSAKFLVSWGFDIIIDRQKNKTKTDDNSANDLQVETSHTINGTGVGPRFSLNYNITDKILIGTEANYYWKSGKDERSNKTTFTTFEFDPSTGTTRQARRTETDEGSEKFKKFQFNVPAVVFLVLKF